jgi:hypothetical protein
MGKYESFFDEKSFNEERPIIEYEEVEVEIEDDLCTCDFNKDNCPVHKVKLNED